MCGTKLGDLGLYILMGKTGKGNRQFEKFCDRDKHHESTEEWEEPNLGGLGKASSEKLSKPRWLEKTDISQEKR